MRSMRLNYILNEGKFKFVTGTRRTLNAIPESHMSSTPVASECFAKYKAAGKGFERFE
jgi:hypothetical protein